MKNLAPHGVPPPTENTFAVMAEYCCIVVTALVSVPVAPPVVLPDIDTLLYVGNAPIYVPIDGLNE